MPLTGFKSDLHIHTVLSPCGDLEMSPSAIVDRALARGLDMIAISDHNTTRQVKVTQKIGREKGLFVLGGVEVTSQEETHCLCYFRDETQLDEFQEFDRTNPGVFGDVQAIWDRHHATSRINLVVSGSVNRLMEKIFFRDSEPLYGRNTGKLVLKPFEPALLKTVFRHYRPRFAPDALLALWTVSGGVARYVDMMMSSRAFTRKAMLASIFSETSPYADEGRTVLADEFGSDYGTYFTILSAVASGKTTSAELKNLLGTDVGGFLGKLEKQYGIVSRKQPLFDRDAAKNGHWQIDDCFFRFWFRFVFKYRYLVELGRYDRLLDIATRDFDTFSGPALERYFRWKFECEGLYTRMGGWWDRKGENEIDLVCEDETRNVLDFYEIKRDPSRIDLRALAHKCDAFLVKNPDKRDRRISLHALSIDDM